MTDRHAEGDGAVPAQDDRLDAEPPKPAVAPSSVVEASGRSSVAIGGNVADSTIVTGSIGTFVDTLVVGGGTGQHEIEIRIEERPQGAGYRLRATLSGERSETITAEVQTPISELEIRSAHEALDRGLLNDPAVRELGVRLFKAVFVGRLGELYAQGRQRRVAYRLRFVLTAPGLERVPWELLYDPERAELLAEAGTVIRSIEHRPDAEGRLATGPVRAPLRVLVAEGSSAPAGRSRRETLAAALGEALRELEDPRALQVGTLGRGPLAGLGATLVISAGGRARRPYHLLHLVCEAGPGPAPDRPVLLFEDGQEMVDPEQLAAAVGQRGVRMAVLTTTSSSRASAADVARAFGPPLLRAGLLAVVVLPIGELDDDGGHFLRDLYDGLLRGLPVDAALGAARQSIAPGAAFDRLPLGAPIVYLTARAEPRFEVQAPRPTPLRLTTLPAWAAEHLSPAALIGIAASAVALLVGLIALVLVVMPGPRDPGVTAQAPTPPASLPRMTGAINVAVAEFGRWEAGAARPWEAGERLAGNLAASLQAAGEAEATAGGQSAGASPRTPDVLVHGPDKTRPVAGNTPHERARSARQLAEEIDADLVIYGNLAEDNATFVPEIYLSNRLISTRESTTDTGQHNFGELKLRDGAMLDFSLDDQNDLRDALSRQARALVYFALGLNANAANRPDRSVPYFQAAIAAIDPARASPSPVAAPGGGLTVAGPATVTRSGAELFHLFLGNVAISQVIGAQGDERTRLLDLAAGEYTLARAASSGYARATIGLAETWFLRSSKGCRQPTTDQAGVDTAVALYREAIQAEQDSPLANVEAKARFGLGRAYVCLILAESQAHTPEAAEQELQAVIAEYQGGNSYVGSWARESYISLANLHLVYGAQGRPDRERAAGDFLGAIEIEIELNGASDRLRGFCRVLGRTEAGIPDPAARPSKDSPVIRQESCQSEYQRGLQAVASPRQGPQSFGGWRERHA